MSSDRPLLPRLLKAFGEREVAFVLDRMMHDSDPLRYLTPEAQQELFDRLSARERFIKRNKAANRAFSRSMGGDKI